MKLKSIVVFFLLFLIGIFWVGCQKDSDDPDIELINTEPFYNIYVWDTINIPYRTTTAGLDSVCLFNNDSITQTSKQSSGAFIFVPLQTGSYEVRLIAYFSGNKKRVTSYIRISASEIHTTRIKLQCTRLNGDEHYFVGERLAITPRPFYSGNDFDFVKKMTFFLNGEDLGTLTSEPYRFESPVILQEENAVELLIIDTDNHRREVELDLFVPADTPPEIELGFRWVYDIRPGYFFSTQDVIYDIEGSDNVVVKHVDFYLDDAYVGTDSINLDYFFKREFPLGKLSSGKHTGYCIAYDDRGNAITSNVVDMTVYGAVEIDDEMVDIEATDDKNVVYTISETKLYRFDPQAEELSKVFDLPFELPTSMDFDDERNRLYIGFSSGHLVYLDESTEIFSNNLLESNLVIYDLEVDSEYDVALVVSTERIAMIHLDNGTYETIPLDMETESTLIADKTNKVIIAGGNPHSSHDDMYRIVYSANSMEYIGEHTYNHYSRKMFLKPGNETFTIMNPYSLAGMAVYSYNFSDWEPAGEFTCQKPETGCYNTSGSNFYLGMDFDKYINIFNTVDYSFTDKFYIPITGLRYIYLMTTNFDDSTLIMATNKRDDEYSKIVFIQL